MLAWLVFRYLLFHCVRPAFAFLGSLKCETMVKTCPCDVTPCFTDADDQFTVINCQFFTFWGFFLASPQFGWDSLQEVVTASRSESDANGRQKQKHFKGVTDSVSV